MEFIITLIVLYGLYKIVFGNKSRPNRSTSSRPSAGRRTIYVEVAEDEHDDDYEYYENYSLIPDVNPADVWIPRDKTAKIGTKEIRGGWVYFGDNLRSVQSEYEQEASLIRPDLDVDFAHPDWTGETMGYWPSYTRISPQSRAAYLEWLTGNRDESDTYIGYVFLYFYGLERRLLVDVPNGIVDQDEINGLIYEIERLIQVYAHNGSFRRYANSLYSTAILLHAPEKARQLQSVGHSREFTPLLKWQLAQCSVADKPLPAHLAISWLIGHPETRLRTPARRCEKEFLHLFEIRYKEKFGEGLVVKPNKKKLTFDYHAASPSLGHNLNVQLPDAASLPDITNLKTPINKLRALAEECIVELEPYSRHLGSKANKADSLNAVSLLPPSLIGQVENTQLDQLRKWLANKVGNESAILVKTTELLDQWGAEKKDKITKKEAESAARLLESVGYGMAPDIRYHGSKFDHDGPIALFKNPSDTDFHPSKEFYLIALIIRLGVMISLIDGHASADEQNYLTTLVEKDGNLTDKEQRSLKAYLLWRLSTPANMVGLKAKLSKIAADQKESIGRILLHVAHVDGRVENVEIKQLQKLFTALDLDENKVPDELHAISAAIEPIRIQYKDDVKDFRIPPSPEPASSDILSIDEELVRLRTAETEQVQDVLADIFIEEDEEESVETNKKMTASLDGLDKKHRQLFDKLVVQDEWERKDVEGFCKELGLMTDGALEVINEWAFELVDAPLIEDGEPVFIDKELVTEIQ